MDPVMEPTHEGREVAAWTALDPVHVAWPALTLVTDGRVQCCEVW